MKKIVHILFILILLISKTSILHSQTLDISGSLIDSTNQQPIAYGDMMLSEINKHIISDEHGKFIFHSVKSGQYTLISKTIGFTTCLQKINVQQNITGLTIYLKESIIDFNEVVITALRSDKMLKDVAIPTQIINAQQIQNTGTTNVADAINTALPGIEFYNEGEGQTFQMQGLATKYTLFLIDGERIAGENRDNIDYTRLNTSNVDRIEIVKGASSSLYGSSAISGVVNIITHTPVRPFEATIFSRFSRFNDLETGANVGFRKDKMISFTDFSKKSSDGYDLTPNTPDSHTVEPFEIYQLNQKIVYNLSPKISFTAKGSYFSRERFDVAATPTHPFYRDFNGGISSKIKCNEKLNLTASMYEDDYSSYDVLERLNNKLNRNYNNTQFTGRLLGDYTFESTGFINKHNIIGGLEYLNDKMFAVRIQDSSKQNQNYALFLQDEFKIKKRWSSVVGFHADIHSEFGTSFSPKASVMYSLGKIIFRGTYGYGFRVPSIKERYYDFDLGFISFKGNKDLKPERSQYTSLSAEFQHSKFDYSINIYNTHLKDMIHELPIAGTTNAFTYVNFTNVNVYGIDNILRMKIFTNFALNGGYSFTYALDMTTKEELIGVSKNTGVAGIEYSKKFNKYILKIILSGKIYSKKIYQNYDNSYVFYNATYPSYSLWKLVTQHEFLQGSVKFTFGIDNILDYRNTTDLINIDPGRRLFIALNVSCDKVYDHFKNHKKKIN